MEPTPDPHTWPGADPRYPPQSESVKKLSNCNKWLLRALCCWCLTGCENTRRTKSCFSLCLLFYFYLEEEAEPEHLWSCFMNSFDKHHRCSRALKFTLNLSNFILKFFCCRTEVLFGFQLIGRRRAGSLRKSEEEQLA